MHGWIKLHRQLQKHWLWQELPFDKRSAWIDLLMLVNYDEGKTPIGSKLIDVERGSRITSIKWLCDRWGWSNTKVRNFLKLLKKDNMIDVKSDTQKTTITILNYSQYQEKNGDENTGGTLPEHTGDISEAYQGHIKNTQTRKIKKDKRKIKKDKESTPPISPPKKYAEFVNMTKEEYQKLVDMFGVDAVKKMIDILDNYKGSTGKKYKSDYRAIRSWVVRRYEEEGGKLQTRQEARTFWDNNVTIKRLEEERRKEHEVKDSDTVSNNQEEIFMPDIDSLVSETLEKMGNPKGR